MRHRYPRNHTTIDRTLVDAIELIPRPVFVISLSGKVLVANSPGDDWLTTSPGRRATVVHAGEPNRELFRVTRSNGRRHGHYLAVLRDTIPVTNDDSTHEKLGLARRRWGLTPRQAEVLVQLSNGLSNAQIATELGCAEATVEIHVSRILDRAGVDSRAGLLATLLWGHCS